MAILIKGGRVINPATQLDEVADVLIKESKVLAIEENISNARSQELLGGFPVEKVIDATGLFVMPGFIDLHVHFRDPGLTHKEDILTGMAAAAHGGYTAVLAMPNTKPVADCADVIEYVHNKAKEGKCIKVYQVGAVTKGQAGEELADIHGMVQAGCPAISEDGKSVMNSNLYREAMKIAAQEDIVVLAHCEDINLVNGGVMNLDAKSQELGLPGISNAVEDVITARDILLAKETGARLHLCHCSTADSVKMVAAAKAEGLPVTAEVCPHHFTLSTEDIHTRLPETVGGAKVSEEMEIDTNFKMNPPLRTKADVEALKQGLKDGIMEVISTDHAPHAFEEKNNCMKKAPFGIVGSETAAALTYTELVLGGIFTPMQMAVAMSYNPAQVMGWETGDIQPGKAADVVLFDPNAVYKIDVNTFASKGKNTPFHGRKVTGKVVCTICDGRIVYEEATR